MLRLQLNCLATGIAFSYRGIYFECMPTAPRLDKIMLVPLPKRYEEEMKISICLNHLMPVKRFTARTNAAAFIENFLPWLYTKDSYKEQTKLPLSVHQVLGRKPPPSSGKHGMR
jgi:hypothetical protein